MYKDASRTTTPLYSARVHPGLCSIGDYYLWRWVQLEDVPGGSNKYTWLLVIAKSELQWHAPALETPIVSANELTLPSDFPPGLSV